MILEVVVDGNGCVVAAADGDDDGTCVGACSSVCGDGGDDDKCNVSYLKSSQAGSVPNIVPELNEQVLSSQARKLSLVSACKEGRREQGGDGGREKAEVHGSCRQCSRD